MPTTTIEPSEPTPTLVRALGLVDATMIVMGSMIGSGIFITSAESARLVGSPGWLLVAWALAGLMTITGALCCAELAAMMPKAGGQYVFLREAYGPSLGFLFGWSMFLVVQTGTIAAVAVAFAKFLGVLIPAVAADQYLVAPRAWGHYAISLSSQQLVAILLIVALTVTNTRGLRAGKLIQNSFTFTKTAALFGLIVVGLTLGLNPKAAAWTSSWWNPVANGWDPAQVQTGFRATGGVALAMLLGRAMIGPLFSQSAWNNVTFTGGEVRNPGRNLPRALVLGCGTVILLYLLANIAYLVTLPFDQIQGAPQDRVGTAVMHAVFGRAGTVAMAVAILISTFGCVNGLILAGARVYYAMARDGLFFERVGTTNRQHVPGVALVAQGVWACLLTLPVTVAIDASTQKASYGNLYSQLLEYIIPVDVAFYMLMVGAVIALRRKVPGAERPYRTFGYPLPALIYLGLAVLVVLDFIVMTPETSGIGVLIVLAGIPVYFLWSRVGRKAE
ncbi:amino acid/polyamine/organocation transporter, APC superfamily [Singulisphaera sp. GP187]|uniref:APC family permease n=1 Tax=Singulisphaera sp. GP187 TaxID=1882752 RepID=UPI00092922FF|nr:amino acid permease [Singulisphaera sp. GP187]SIO66783.1 amino acid/polyamine/organocation transporter, APC superfamily [Singulisphaera sp. GP187]